MCNNCGDVLIDHNPQTGAELHEVDTSKYDELIKGEDKEDGETVWICPNCKTDAYLTDL